MTTETTTPAAPPKPKNLTPEQIEALRDVRSLALEVVQLVELLGQWGPRVVQPRALTWRLVDAAGLMSEVAGGAHGPSDPTGRGFFIGDSVPKP